MNAQAGNPRFDVERRGATAGLDRLQIDGVTATVVRYTLTAECYGVFTHLRNSQHTHLAWGRLGKRFATNLRGRTSVETPTLQYFETAQVAGIPLRSITVRLANGRVLGHFRGLIIDPFNQHLRYLVVRARGWFGKTTLVPAHSPRIDLAGRAIEIDANDNDLWTVQNFTLQKALNFGVCARAA
jgi:hypothetical protein